MTDRLYKVQMHFVFQIEYLAYHLHQNKTSSIFCIITQLHILILLSIYQDIKRCCFFFAQI